MKGLILAGGSGSRLRPLTHTGPKQLIPIANKPIILYAIDDLRDAGITDIGIILGFNMPEQIKALLGDGSEYGVKITYIMQGEPKGIAHAVGVAEEFMGKSPFVVYLGDNLLKGGIGKLVKDFDDSKADCVTALSKVKQPERFGVVEVKDGEIVSIEEKPEKPKSDLAMIGIYIFNSKVFDVIRKLKPSCRNELEITDTIQILLDEGNNVRSHTVGGWWKDTGMPSDLLEANHLVLMDLDPKIEGKLGKDVKKYGSVSIGKGSTVKGDCVLRGPLILGKNCKIGPDAYIGPYTSIGDDSVLRNCEIESSIVMSGANIDARNQRFTDSLIGKDCRILNDKRKLPKAHKLVIGENSEICL